MEEARRTEAEERHSSQEEMLERTNNSVTAETQTDLATAIGSIIGKLPTLIFLSTLVFAISVLYFGQAVLIPVAFSLLLTFLLSPLVNGLERLRLGRIPSVILVVVLSFSLLAAIGWIVTAQFTALVAEIPQYQRNIKQKVVDLRQLGKGGAIEQVQKTVGEIKSEIEKAEEPAKPKQRPREVIVEAEQSSTFWPIPTIAGPLLERLGSAGLAIVLVIFMLIERDDLRNRLIRLIGYGRITVTTNALEEAGARISRYLLMQSIINSCYGVAVGISLYLIGLPYSILWGFLAALLRFIPYIGPWVAAIVPSALALAVFEGWAWPLVVAGIFVILELFTNMILEPLLYGDSAGVSQVALLISVAFWTWVWGPIGLVMATPLTVCLVVLGKHVPQLKFITVLMSDQPVADTKMIFYQRLLAMDRNEAVHIVEEYIKDHSPEQVYDEVMLPALNFARLDRERDNLTDEQDKFIFEEIRTIVANLESKQSGSARGPDESGTLAEESVPARPNVRILGCPARDEIDEAALLMFQHLLNSTRFEIEVIGDAKLASEVVAEAGEKQTSLVCIAAVQPGGLANTRYLCKRLRTQFSDIKIIVGLWGFSADLEATRKSLLASGADQVGTSLLESRDQIGNLSQLVSGSGPS